MANQTGRQKRRAARAKRKHKRPENKSEPIASPPPTPTVNPDAENKENPNAKAKNKTQAKRQKHVGRKMPMELIIAGAVTISVVFWILSGVAAYKHHETSLIWTIYLAIIFTILVFFLIWQKRVWDRPKIGQTSTERPEVSLEDTRIFLQPGKRVEVRVLFKNRRKAAARNVRFGGVDVIVPTPFTGPLHPGELPPVDMFPSLAVNAMMVARTWMGGHVISAKDIADLNEGKCLFFHYSKGQYEDDTGNVYPIDFCLMYLPEHGNLMLAPMEYWPKSKDSEQAS
ncbi:MAG TPA: hypothetical protein VGX92_06065 [Pyrinomonadaceae bacterium]|jgi:hypothetical protein|nr:hypothetical protein [Pyrinomonadaceae bacterium]